MVPQILLICHRMLGWGAWREGEQRVRGMGHPRGLRGAQQLLQEQKRSYDAEK